MADDQVTFIDTADGSKVYQKAYDIGSGLHALAVAPVGTDVTNEVLKVAEKWVQGSLTGAADGATITGTGVLRKLILTNGSGSAITVAVRDNTSGSGNKLMPDIAIPANTTREIDVAIPFTIGVHIDWSNATSCDGCGYYQAVN